MSLNSILKEIEFNRPNAEMDITMGSPDTYGGRVGLKKAAQEAVKRLEEQYHSELLSHVAFIVVTGSSRDSFVELASSEKFGCFSVDPEEFFKDLTSRMSPALFGREGVKYLFNTASNILEDKSMELDIRSYNMLQFNEKYNIAVNKPEDFVPLIRDAVVDQVGSEIIGLNAVKSVVKKAIEKGHSAPVTPIVFSTSDEKFALELNNNLRTHLDNNGEKRGLTANVFLVVSGKGSKSLQGTKGAVFIKTANEDSITEALDKIRTNVLL